MEGKCTCLVLTQTERQTHTHTHTRAYVHIATETYYYYYDSFVATRRTGHTHQISLFNSPTTYMRYAVSLQKIYNISSCQI